jgi:glycosyltransferase involved in cell wall biosynthesis
LGSNPTEPALVSVVITVKNEGPHLRRLFESLLVQEPPFEVILVDAFSRDDSFDIASEFAQRYPDRFHAVQRAGSRGHGRNTGAEMARAQLLAFTDGDCVADSQWLASLRRAWAAADVVVGRSVAIGKAQYAALDRVELFVHGSDVTAPSCNLGYRSALFQRLGGFDTRFVTAEDIDLNLRALESGALLRETPDAVIYQAMRGTFVQFLYQAFWNGYGRKQLTEKHGSLWGSYRVRRLIATQRSVIAWARLTAATGGYMFRVFTGGAHRMYPTGAPVSPSARP